MTLGEVIAALQVRLAPPGDRLSINRLAPRLGVTDQTIRNWLRGASQPTGLSKRALARAWDQARLPSEPPLAEVLR